MSIYLDRIGLNEPQIQAKYNIMDTGLSSKQKKTLQTAKEEGREQIPLIQEQGYQIYARGKASFEKVVLRMYLSVTGIVSTNLDGDQLQASCFPQNQNVTVTTA